MKKRMGLAFAFAAAVAFAGNAAAQPVEFKLGGFVSPMHFMTKYLDEWGKSLEAQSNGALVFKHFPGGQMGPAPKYHDLARLGALDAAWILHGATPGRFALTELVQLPYVVPSAEVGTKVLNHPDVRKHLDAEHGGVDVLYLFTHQPGNLHTAERPVRAIEDMKGLRMRFASSTIRDWVDALGGTPVGIPPNQQAESLQKKTIDGVFIDYGGAHTAFQLGGLIKYTTEMYSYVSSFGLIINPEALRKYPGAVQELIAKTTSGVSEEVGQLWDAADAPGRQYLIDNGNTVIALSAEEDARFRAIGDKVVEAKLAELEGKGLPAREVFGRMKALSAEYAKTSKNFWQGSQRR